MPLQDVVSKLQKRILNIRERGETIGEENTKATLIEPLLSALGWDMEELTEVHREYKRKAQDNPVDYALFLLREPRLFIEAKALGVDLTNRKWASQIINYANTAGVKWCVLTDGDEYRLFNSHAEGDIEEKLFWSIRISISGADEQTVQTLALLSKEKMGENLLTSLWTAHLVDRKVKEAAEGLFKNEDPGLIKLLRKKTTGLGPSEIRASLKRAVPIRIDFPFVPVTVPVSLISISESRKPSREPRARRDAHAATPKRFRCPISDCGVSSHNRQGIVSHLRQVHKLDKSARDAAMAAAFDTKVSDLIQAGLIQAPLHLERAYKGVHLKAVIQNDGTVTFNGEAYDSLSMAASMARKSVIGVPPGRPYPQTNGWTFWRFQDPETGELLKIDVLRQKYLKRS